MSDRPKAVPAVRVIPSSAPNAETRLVRAVAILIEAAKAMQGKKAA